MTSHVVTLIFQSYHREFGQVIWDVFQQTTRPYLDMLWNWIAVGELKDPFNEFFILKQIPAFLEDYWENFVVLKFISTLTSLGRRLKDSFISAFNYTAACNLW